MNVNQSLKREGYSIPSTKNGDIIKYNVGQDYPEKLTTATKIALGSVKFNFEVSFIFLVSYDPIISIVCSQYLLVNLILIE